MARTWRYCQATPGKTLFILKKLIFLEILEFLEISKIFINKIILLIPFFFYTKNNYYAKK
jgi:hypothetical protein